MPTWLDWLRRLIAGRGDARRSYTQGPWRLTSGELAQWFAADDDDTGIVVSEETALQTAAVWSAVTLISEVLASLPIKFYTVERDGSRRPSAHPIGRLFQFTHDGVSPSYHLIEAMTAQAATWGQAYARIHRGGGGLPTRLELLHPGRMQIIGGLAGEISPSGAVGYVYTHPQGRQESLLTHEVLHLRGPSMDGLVGYSRIKLGRRAVALLIAAERFSGSFFSDGASPSIGLEHPALLSDEAAEKLRRSLEGNTGFRRAHRVFLAEEGMKIVQTGANPNDSQLIETRNAQILEVCRLFRVPPRLLMAELASFTYANLAQDNAAFVQYCLAPWGKRWTSEIDLKLLPNNDVYSEVLFDALLASTTAERYAAYAQGLGRWLTRDEIRQRENLPPWPGGDTTGESNAQE